jgi:hypothetical protein
MKKVLFMFLALLLPVLIFLFLKSFGKNEFAVPILFADSVSAPVACAVYTYKAPYVIEDSVLQKLEWNSNDSLTLIVFEDGNKVNQHERKIQLERVFTEFKKVPLQVIRVHNNQPVVPNEGKALSDLSLPEPDFQTFRNCVFLLSTANDAVIIDRHKRIRGQYNLLKREDADRMIMQEMNILLKRY